MSKDITIETLAGMVKNGFDGVYKELNNRFERVDKRFDKIEGKLSNLEQDTSYLRQRVKEIEKTLERHEEILLQHSDELKIIHKILDDISDSKSRNEEIINNLQRRVERLEVKIGLAIK